MESHQEKSRRGFLVKQAVLLAITVVLVVFFTIPFLGDVKTALSPGRLGANAQQAENEVAALQKKLNGIRSMVLMGAGDEAAQEKLKKEIEELKRRIAVKEMENKHLQDEMALVRSLLQLVGTKSAPAPSPAMDTTHKVAELLAKLFGCVGSLVSGTMFLVSWWKKRREAAQDAAT